VANGNDCTVEYSCGRKSSGTEGSIKQLSHSLGIFNHPCQLGHSLKKLTASAVDIPCNIYDQFWSMARLSMIYPALGLLTLNNDYPFLDDLPDFTHQKLRFYMIFHRGSCHRSLLCRCRRGFHRSREDQVFVASWAKVSTAFKKSRKVNGESMVNQWWIMVNNG